MARKKPASCCAGRPDREDVTRSSTTQESISTPVAKAQQRAPTLHSQAPPSPTVRQTQFAATLQEFPRGTQAAGALRIATPRSVSSPRGSVAGIPASDHAHSSPVRSIVALQRGNVPVFCCEYDCGLDGSVRCNPLRQRPRAKHDRRISWVWYVQVGTYEAVQEHEARCPARPRNEGIGHRGGPRAASPKEAEHFHHSPASVRSSGGSWDNPTSLDRSSRGGSPASPLQRAAHETSQALLLRIEDEIQKQIAAEQERVHLAQQLLEEEERLHAVATPLQEYQNAERQRAYNVHHAQQKQQLDLLAHQEAAHAERARVLQHEHAVLTGRSASSAEDDQEGEEPADGARAVAISAAIQAGRYGLLSPAPSRAASDAATTPSASRNNGDHTPSSSGRRHHPSVGPQHSPASWSTASGQYSGGNGSTRSTGTRARSPVGRPRGRNAGSGGERATGRGGDDRGGGYGSGMTHVDDGRMMIRAAAVMGDRGGDNSLVDEYIRHSAQVNTTGKEATLSTTLLRANNFNMALHSSETAAIADTLSEYEAQQQAAHHAAIQQQQQQVLENIENIEKEQASVRRQQMEEEQRRAAEAEQVSQMRPVCRHRLSPVCSGVWHFAAALTWLAS